MSDHTFTCPDCGGHLILETQARKVLVYVEDQNNGPELYEDKEEAYYLNHWECNDCSWRLPCRDVNDVINFVVDQEIDRRT